jgi:Flp pilus assembly protein CpaB
MIVPGSHVDLIATVQGEQGGEMISRTVVQNIEVGAVGQRMIKQPDKKDQDPVVFRSVTLLATPSEAEAIELAATNGRPRLVLRNGSDKDFTNTPGVTAANLRGHTARKTDPAYSTVKIIRGTAESEVRFDTGWFDPSAKANTNAATDSNKAVSNTPTDQVTK